MTSASSSRDRAQVSCYIVPGGLTGTVDGVCAPTKGFHFTDLTRENFGKIVSKHGHRVMELAARFEF